LWRRGTGAAEVGRIARRTRWLAGCTTSAQQQRNQDQEGTNQMSNNLNVSELPSIDLDTMSTVAGGQGWGQWVGQYAGGALGAVGGAVAGTVMAGPAGGLLGGSAGAMAGYDAGGRLGNWVSGGR
jgi:hypothetical protein